MRHLPAGFVLALVPFAAVAQDGTVPDAPAGGDAQSAIEARIAKFNPCEPLGTEVLGISLGVNRVREVQIERSDLRLRGDGVSFDVSGRLTCRGAGEGTSGDLSFDISASLEAVLSTCEIKEVTVDLGEAEGEMSWAFDAASPVIEGVLMGRVEEEAKNACTTLAS
ncbi:hypothetical protein LX81_00223 [Palleronia aestuarii]|uniref:Uncharacterized protein n=1 Tax=Palleronia aestuarii TaxID=568105 RepID=A0A2W7P8R1_9RHOB|nr:hypothetical protein [Palleronia aestuarii]PZX19762.1 hypothetical protein LX81_00223 [Palleronia aestuarii]